MKSWLAGALTALAVAVLVAVYVLWDNTPRGHDGLDATLWMQTAAEHDMATTQAFALAKVMLDRALADGGWTAALEQSGDASALPPAVIFDMDETLVDNSPFAAKGILDNDRRFNHDKWVAWVKRKQATALPGAIAFARYATQHDVAIFYITNRDHRQASATLANLKALGFPVAADGANLLSRNKQPGWGSDKATRRAFVARTHRILLLFGDDLNDFMSGVRGKGVTMTTRKVLAARHRDNWGTRWIVLPNPAYGSWQRATYGFQKSLTDHQIRQQKHQVLKAY